MSSPSGATLTPADQNVVKDILSAMYDPGLVTTVELHVDQTITSANENGAHETCWKEALTYIPWTYHSNPELNQKVASAATPEQQREQNLDSSTLAAAAENHTTNNNTFPAWTYIDLRIIQNQKFAHDRLLQGIEHAKQHHYDQAEACYKEVLSLVPHHADCLVAYAALCATIDTGDGERLSRAVELLNQAMEIDPHCHNAQLYLDQIVDKQRQLQQQQQRGALGQHTKQPLANVLLVPQKALKDVMAERALLRDSNGYDLVPSTDDDKEEEQQEGDLQKKETRKRRHKKEKKRRHSNRRKRHKRSRRSDDSNSSDEDSDSSGRSTRRESSSRHRRTKPRIRGHDRDSSSDENEDRSSRRRKRRTRRDRSESTSDDEDSVESGSARYRSSRRERRSRHRRKMDHKRSSRTKRDRSDRRRGRHRHSDKEDEPSFGSSSHSSSDGEERLEKKESPSDGVERQVKVGSPLNGDRILCDVSEGGKTHCSSPSHGPKTAEDTLDIK